MAVEHLDDSRDESLSDEVEVTQFGDISIPKARRFSQSIAHNNQTIIITKIIATNFKSYAGRVLIGPFHLTFSCVIGANGCGKSNIIDSLLFVFGYRTKKIRMDNGVTDAIHKSTFYKNKSCTVEIYFAQFVDKDDGQSEILPGSEFYISKYANMKGNSFYTIDGRKVEYKAVIEKLSENGVNLVHSRFLILQGEIEQIASMGAKGYKKHEVGLLEYLDDIIGTVRYKVALDKLEEKKEQLSDVKYELSNDTRNIEASLDILTEPMEEIVLHLKTVNRITRLKSQKIQLILYRISKAANEKERIRSKFTEKLESLDNKITNGKQEVKVEEDRIKKMDKNVKIKKETMIKLQNKKEELIKELKDLQNALKEMKKRREENLKLIKKNEELLQNSVVTLEKIEEEGTQLIQETERFGEEKENAAQELSMAKDNASRETERIKRELIQLEAEANELKDIYTVKNTEYVNKRARFNHCTKENSKEQIQLNQLDELNKEIEQVLENLQKYEPELERLIRDKRDREMSIKDLECRVEPLRKKMLNLNKEIQKCEEQIRETESVASNRRSNNVVLNYIMEQKRNNSIPGIFGRLGDLGGIDGKYDVAISTACGMLNYILVNSVETMTKCFNALERDNVGRASFISLEKVERFRSHMNNRIETPENVPRLFDLLKVNDQRVLPAFYFAMRDTLVAKDMRQAQRIAYGTHRYRVVTLDGGLIELSGTMSGGGKTVLKGMMGKQVTVNTADTSIQNIENERKVEELKGKLNLVEKELMPLEDRLKDEMAQISNLNHEITSTKTIIQDLKLSQKDKSNKKLILEKTIAQTKHDDSKFRRLESELERSQEDAKEAENRFKLKETEVKEKKNEMEKIILERTKNEQKAFDTANKKWKSANTKLDEVLGKKSAIEKSIKRAKERKANNEKEFEDGIGKEKKYEEKCEMLTKDRNAIIKQIENLEIPLKEEENELKTSMIKQSEIKEKIEYRNKKKLMLSLKLESVEKELSELRSSIPNYEHQLGNLSLKEIPDLINFDEEDDDGNEMEFEEQNDEEGNNGTESSKVLVKYTAEELEKFNEERISKLIKTEESQLAAQDEVDLSLIKSYNDKVNSYKQKKQRLRKVTEEYYSYESVYQETKRNRCFEFQSAVSLISQKLKEVYCTIAPQGDAFLDLLDAADPYSEGIVYNVRPPSKKWNTITTLSGGEKTLSSLALIFALHYYKPTPFYVMDEIDAALDWKNVSIVGRYIKERTKNAQFIVVSLRTNMFGKADFITGVTKIDECTRICGLDLKYYEQFASNGMELLESSDDSDKENREESFYADRNNGSPSMFDSD